ncbi:hypothetical protein JHK87_024366 [Glycine soja]|nr:hypothetical protein JHK87_024366 [Glycine soja]
MEHGTFGKMKTSKISQRGDHLTTKAKRSSKKLGTTKGTSITSDLDRLSRIWVAKLTLRMNDDKGSSNVRLGNSHKKTWLEVDSFVEELQKIEGVQSVSKGHFFRSPSLAPTFQDSIFSWIWNPTTMKRA